MKEVDLLDWLPLWTKVFLDVRVSTLAIMVATVTNVIVSWYIGRRTKDAAEAARDGVDAAKQSADASMRSAEVALKQARVSMDTFEASQRPYFAVSQVVADAFEDEQKAELKLVMKNYGTVPAAFREFTIESIAELRDDDPTKLSKYSYAFTASGQSVVLPGEDEVFHCNFDQRWLYPLIANGEAILDVKVNFHYVSLMAGKEYEFRSVHQYDAKRKHFVISEATMT